MKGGVDGIVPVGTTGESPTVEFEEHVRIIELVVHYAKGRCKVIAGTGANSTEEAVYLTKSAEYAGADGSLQVSPYYNKPSQEGLYAHFSEIANSTNLPIVLTASQVGAMWRSASTPSRAGGGLPEHRLHQGSGGDADRVSQLRAALPKNFSILSGDDALTLPFMSVGAQGVISVANNLLPKQLTKMVHSYLKGDHKGALKLHEKYYPLFKDLFIETNPVPVKSALAMKGLVKEEYRLPLVKLNPDNRRQLRATLKATGVIKQPS